MDDNSSDKPTGKRVSVTGAVLIISGLLVAAAAGAFSFRDLFGDRENRRSPPAEDPAVQRQERTAAATEETGLDFDALEHAVSALGTEQRGKVLGEKRAFQRFVQQEAARSSVLAAARAEGLDDDPTVAYLMRRRAEQLLVENYLQRKTRSAVPPEFPTEAQMREAYDRNLERFRVGERVHVWQIFLPLPATTDDAQAGKLEAHAKDLVKQIRSGTLSFAQAAAKHSRHPASRINGGYMGLLNVSDLLPELKEPLLASEQGSLSGPVKGREGVHILRRGARLPAEVLPFEAVRERIRTELRRTALVRARQVAVNEARTAHVTTVPDPKLEEWRLKLRVADSGPVSR